MQSHGGSGHGRWIARGLGCAALALAISCDDARSDRGPVSEKTEALLSGRVFGTTDGKPLKDADIRVNEAQTKSAGDGSFAISYVVDGSEKRSVHAQSASHVPVTKTLPGGDGYLELFAKEIDARQTLDPATGGELKGTSGASVKIAANSLKDRSGKRPKSVELAIALPDVTKNQELDALPGAFGAVRGGKKGKVSVESPIYVQASDEIGSALVVDTDKKVKITLPGSNKKANERMLHYFDEDQGVWVEWGLIAGTLDENGLEVYAAEVDRFGWFSLGTFIEELSCLRACVVRPDQSAVPFARAIATGVNVSLQSAEYAGVDGCFVLEVPANTQLSLSAQTQGSYAFAGLLTAPAGGSVADPSSCLALPTIVLNKAAQAAAPCAQGALECGAVCVDSESDERHCGACDNACGASELCLGGVCASPDRPEPRPMDDAGTMAPGMDSGPDAGEPDAGAGPPCVSDPGCESAVGGCFARVPGNSELGTVDFCISRFEMKNVADAPSSIPAGLPWMLESAVLVESACSALGAEFSVPTNAQWQTLARNIEGVAENWSGGEVGAGDLARGHVDSSPPVALSVENLEDPCDQSNAPQCTTPGATFSQRRTHVLSSGAIIWDVGGNVVEWVQPVLMSTYYADYVAGLSTAAEELKSALGPAGTYAVGSSPRVSASYPSYALVEAGSLAVVEGKNFTMGRIWVRSGGMLLIRGSNFQGDIYLEAGAMFLNSGSNIYPNTTSMPTYGQVLYSADSLVTGSLGTGNPTIAEASYAECGGTCPDSVLRFTQDGSRGLGYAFSFNDTKLEWRGGRVGIGPMGGVFTGLTPFAAGPQAGFRCVRPANP